MPKRAAGAPPAIALGAMNFGKRTPPAESERIVRRAIERGVRVFDTANAYNDGESERILGRALGRDRDSVTVATKAGFARIAGKPEGLAPDVLERALAASLDRLGTDYVDVYYLHVPDHQTPIERTLGAMKTLVEAGRVRAWGVSNYAAWQILEIDHLADAMTFSWPAASQVLYNVLHRQLEIDYFAFARRYPIHTTVFNPLAGGLLTGKHSYADAPAKGSRFDNNGLYQRRYWSRAMFDRVDALRPIADRAGVSLVTLAYAWIAAKSDVDSILVGPATVAQLDDALDAISVTLPSEILAAIDELARAWSGTDTSYVR
jgi:aryl-alcohol dehydrogenase-like predicted oxidoreductase